MTMNYKKICEEAIAVVKDAGIFISKERMQIKASVATSKGLHDFVTHVDKGSEQILIAGLKRLLPDAGFIAEESGYDGEGNEYVWVIDPLDGTTNFIHQCPPFAISVALMQGHEIVAGIVYEVVLDECFYAWKDGGAYCNGKPIHVSQTSTLDTMFIATGFPYHAFDRLEPFMKSLEYFFINSPGVRRLGSAATDFAYVACGRFDAFYEYNLNPWDVAAGAFIVMQAGGKASDFSGGDNFVFGKEIIASNSAGYKVFKEAIEKIMIKKEY